MSTVGVPGMRYGCAPAPYGHGSDADVRRGRRDAQPVVGERVLDAERERERVAGLRVQVVLDDDAVLLPLRHAPRDPADEAVDRGLRAVLVDRQLMVAAAELVAPVPRSGSATG